MSAQLRGSLQSKMKKLTALATVLAISLSTPIQAHPSHQQFEKDIQLLKELQVKLVKDERARWNFPKVSIGSLTNCARRYRSYLTWGTYFPGCNTITVGVASNFSNETERRVILAHEWFHHLQHHSGKLYGDDAVAEKTADCFAGIAFGQFVSRGEATTEDLERAKDFLLTSGSPVHGSGENRWSAFAHGAARFLQVPSADEQYPSICGKVHQVLRAF